MNIVEAFETVHVDLREDVREALLVLSEKLFAVSKKWGGELGTEARIVWIDAHRNLGTENAVSAVREVLVRVSSIESFVDNWTQCAKSGTPDKDEDWTEIDGAREAATKALLAVHALVDSARERTKTRPFRGQRDVIAPTGDTLSTVGEVQS
jgi:hypothetical protein